MSAFKVLARAACVLALFSLSGCAGAGLSLLGAAIPKVAANGQAGALNSQTVGATTITRPSITNARANTITQTGKETSSVKAGTVHQVTVNNNGPWTITPAGLALALFCWLALPSHASMVSSVKTAFAAAFRRKKNA